MATQQPASNGDLVHKILGWIQENRRIMIGAAAVAAVLAGGVWFAISAQQRREAFAARSLATARAAAQAGNLPLAASDLARLIDSYGGTTAADEATILLAQVRLLQEQPEQAVAVLERALERGLDDQFHAAALGLLGGALEDLDRMSEAAQAYERAAQASWYDFLAAQYLIDAGRAHWSAGDTASAVAAYERIVSDFPDSPSALEAKVRLGELTNTGIMSVG